MITFDAKNPTETLRYVRDYARSPYNHGYPLVLEMRDGSEICGPCARMEYRRISKEVRRSAREGWGDDAWIPVALGVYYEGAPIPCDHGLSENCLREIESAYGDPYADDPTA